MKHAVLPSQHAPVAGHGLPPHDTAPKVYPPELQFGEPTPLPRTPRVQVPVVRLQHRPIQGLGEHVVAPTWVSLPQLPKTPGM